MLPPTIHPSVELQELVRAAELLHAHHLDSLTQWVPDPAVRAQLRELASAMTVNFRTALEQRFVAPSTVSWSQIEEASTEMASPEFICERVVHQLSIRVGWQSASELRSSIGRPFTEIRWVMAIKSLLREDRILHNRITGRGSAYVLNDKAMRSAS